MDSQSQRKLSNALYGVQVSSIIASDSMSKLFESINPPGYMIKMVLMNLYGGRLPRGGDKSEWSLSIRYKGKIFIIEDYRRYKWNIWGEESEEVIARELAKKIVSCAKIMNRHLKKIAEKSFKDDNFVLQNNYYNASNTYEFFAEQVRKLLQKKIRGRSKGKASFVDMISPEMERRTHLKYYTLATSVFFFSLTETIFDSVFSLSDRKDLTYADFRKKDWNDKLKFLIPLEGEISELYNELCHIRKYYRNIPAHSSPEYFFFYEGFGLIPSNFEALSAPHMIPTIGFETEKAERILNCYERFLAALEGHSMSVYGVMYAKSDLPILISKEYVNDLKRYMGSIGAFEDELKRRSERQDAIDNMEI
jgi:hypothetical protein